MSHPTVTCDGCGTSPVYGMRWKCATCYDYDLCTECYMSNKHSLEHCFLRYDTPRSEGWGHMTCMWYNKYYYYFQSSAGFLWNFFQFIFPTEFQFQLDLEEGESKLKDSSKELLCQEGKIGAGGIRMVCCLSHHPAFCLLTNCLHPAWYVCATGLLAYHNEQWFFIGGIGSTGIVKEIKGWRNESYVSLSLMHIWPCSCILHVQSYSALNYINKEEYCWGWMGDIR